jgi:hypothetical protein
MKKKYKVVVRFFIIFAILFITIPVKPVYAATITNSLTLGRSYGVYYNDTYAGVRAGHNVSVHSDSWNDCASYGLSIYGTTSGNNGDIHVVGTAARVGTCYAQIKWDISWETDTTSYITVNISQGFQAALYVNAPASLTYGSTSTLTSSGGSGTGAVTYSTGS